MKQAEKLRVVNVGLPPSLIEELNAKAEEIGISRSELIRALVRMAVSRDKIADLGEYGEVESKAHFGITVGIGLPNENDVSVLLEYEDCEAIHWIAACEYFLASTAKESPLPFEEALCRLCEGAKDYEERILNLSEYRGKKRKS